MIGVRPEGCIRKPCSAITPNRRDMRSEFGYAEVIRNREQRAKNINDIK
jgi:hypothetical protein